MLYWIKKNIWFVISIVLLCGAISFYVYNVETQLAKTCFESPRHGYILDVIKHQDILDSMRVLPLYDGYKLLRKSIVINRYNFDDFGRSDAVGLTTYSLDSSENSLIAVKIKWYNFMTPDTTYVYFVHSSSTIGYSGHSDLMPRSRASKKDTAYTFLCPRTLDTVTVKLGFAFGEFYGVSINPNCDGLWSDFRFNGPKDLASNYFFRMRSADIF